MPSQPVPRYEAFDLYWHFAAERQRIFNIRLAGKPAPWTEDAILTNYKFCNVFRASDRVSQYLIRNVAYGDDQGSAEDRMFQIVAFRMFSRESTWNHVREFLGRSPRIDDLASERFTHALEHARATEGGLYTGAFILCANNAYGHSAKHLNHVDLFRHMFVMSSLASDILEAKSLEDVYRLLHAYPLMGDFMSYQTAIDLNYSEFLNFDENDFTQPGPGALRGISKCFESLGGLSPKEVINWMVDRQEAEFDRLGLEFSGLWGRPLHAIDCQGLFCETDKYCREALPELASARKRIKAKFNPSPRPMRLFYPPKWGLNDRVPIADVMGDPDRDMVLNFA